MIGRVKLPVISRGFGHVKQTERKPRERFPWLAAVEGTASLEKARGHGGNTTISRGDGRDNPVTSANDADLPTSATMLIVAQLNSLYPLA